MNGDDIWSYSSACWGGNHFNCGLKLLGPRNSDTCICDCHSEQFEHPSLGTQRIMYSGGCLIPLVLLAILGGILIAV